MRMRHFAESQIISILKEYVAGISVKEICRKYAISDTTFYKWKNRYFGPTEPAIQKQLKKESKFGRLKRLCEFISKENLTLRNFIDSTITEESTKNTHSFLTHSTSRLLVHNSK